LNCPADCAPFVAGVNLPYAGVTVEDLRSIRSAGLDHVRQPFDPDRLDLPTLKRFVMNARAAGLRVIVDSHPRGDFKRRYFASSAVRSRYEQMWRTVIQALPSDGVYLELMNEPGDARWWGYQRTLIERLTDLTGARFIASGGGYSTIWDLTSQKPYRLKNVVYNFHYYSPMGYTHQGASWLKAYSAITDRPYPTADWHKKRIAKDVELAAAWSRKHGVPLICNEFGAWKAAPNREAYIRDVAQTLRGTGIGYSLWEFRGGFSAPLELISPLPKQRPAPNG
jgi:endoglucanase